MTNNSIQWYPSAWVGRLIGYCGGDTNFWAQKSTPEERGIICLFSERPSLFDWMVSECAPSGRSCSTCGRSVAHYEKGSNCVGFLEIYFFFAMIGHVFSYELANKLSNSNCPFFLWLKYNLFSTNNVILQTIIKNGYNSKNYLKNKPNLFSLLNYTWKHFR